MLRVAVTSAADRTPSLPAALSAFSGGGLGYGRSAATLLTPSASHPPSSHQAGGGGRLAGSPPHRPPCVSRRSAAVAWDALSGGDVARRHPIDPRRRVMAPRGAFAGGIALRSPLVVSHMPGPTRLTTRLALPHHRSLREAVPPAQLASPASRRTPMMCAVVKRLRYVHTSFSKGAFGDADVPQVTPLE